MDYYDHDPDPITPPKDPQPRSFRTGLALGCLVPTVPLCAIGAGLLYLVGKFLGVQDDPIKDVLPPILRWAVVVLVSIAAHGFMLWWIRRQELESRAAALLNAPFLPAYVAAGAWWYGDWPAWWIAWGLGVLLGLSAVLVWWFRRPADPRRAIATLAAVLVLVGGSGLGIVAIAWEDTDAFGWRGEATPWGALNALFAASCQSDSDFYYTHRPKSRKAKCPAVPDAYNGEYDKALFDRLTCDDQPKQAFQRFWDWNKEYGLLFNLQHKVKSAAVDRIPTLTPYPPEIKGKHAVVIAEMLVDAAFHIPEDEEQWVMRAPSGATEEWSVTLDWATAGGWKVCGINIGKPIEPTIEPAR